MGDPERRGERRLWAWALFDVAATPFGTVIITFVFATYFARAVAGDEVTGTALWGWTLTASSLTAALLSPLIGGIVDAGGPRKPWLAVVTAIWVTACTGLWLVTPEPGSVLLALALVGLANLAGETSGVFYNAMLADLAPRERIGRWSGRAWGMGYAGGLVCLVIALVLFIQPEKPAFGLSREGAEHVRIVGPMVALWLAIFALPLFLFCPDRPRAARSLADAVGQELTSLRERVARVARDRNLLRFLLAAMLYTDGLNTLFAFGGLYAAGTFGMSLEQVLQFGIVLNLTAGLGAVAFADLDDRLGARTTVLLSLAGLILFGTAALVVREATAFWVVGAALGLFIGPVQAATRSLMARLAPPERRAEMFGLLALSGRVTAFAGPFLFGTVTLWTGTQRAGMATILLFWLAGAVLIAGVREPRGGATVTER
jgi:UMF1 family MFS transporter